MESDKKIIVRYLVHKLNNLISTHKKKDWSPYQKLNSKIKELYEFEGRVPTSGVYMIGDFYIGRTSNIRRRLIEHLFELILREDNNLKYIEGYYKPKVLKFNNEKLDRLLEAFDKGKIKVQLLSSNQDDEIKLINQYFRTHKLTNKMDVSFESYKISKEKGLNQYENIYFEIKLNKSEKFKDDFFYKMIKNLVVNWDDNNQSKVSVDKICSQLNLTPLIVLPRYNVINKYLN